MLLKEIPQEFRKDHLFRYKYGLVEYQCKATYLPFGVNNREKYKGLELDEIYTPLIHLEWEAMNTEKSIYRSHWIMPCDVLWWLENRDETAYDEMVNYAALNNGYLQRVKDEDNRLQKSIQMSLF
jgi:hypothetical protein